MVAWCQEEGMMGKQGRWTGSSSSWVCGTRKTLVLFLRQSLGAQAGLQFTVPLRVTLNLISLPLSAECRVQVYIITLSQKHSALKTAEEDELAQALSEPGEPNATKSVSNTSMLFILYVGRIRFHCNYNTLRDVK